MTKRIGIDAALRSFITRGDKCKTCQFLGDKLCNDAVTTIEKRLGGMLDPYYFIVVVNCNKYEQETLTIKDIENGLPKLSISS